MKSLLKLNSIRDEIRENAPYKVIQVERAEADDIIEKEPICTEHVPPVM